MYYQLKKIQNQLTYQVHQIYYQGLWNDEIYNQKRHLQRSRLKIH